MRPIGIAVCLTIVCAATLPAEGSSDELLRLVPPDAGATLAVDDLRGHARSFLGSALEERLRQLPAVRAWFDSDRFGAFRKAVRSIEKALGEPAGTLRDDLLGDSVVLTLHLAPDAGPEEARGLLLTRVANRPLLARLIARLNAGEARNGQEVHVVDHAWRGASYSIREFQPPGRSSEYYAILEDNTFAWSNSETLIQGVLDRKAGRLKGLSAEPRFQELRGRLSEQSAVRLFVDPRFVKQVLAANRPAGDRIGALFLRYLDAVAYFGATMEWRDGLVVRTEETLDVGRLDPWLKRWAARPSGGPPALDSVPATALGVAALHVDFEALTTPIEALIPASDQARSENLMLALRGLCLGRDVKTALLPKLGPGVLISLDPSADLTAAQPFHWVARAGLGGHSEVAEALRNALRTVLAFAALDANRADGQARVESRSVAGKDVTALSADSPFAFTVDDDQVLIGPSADAVGRHLPATARPSRNRFESVRAAYFPKAESFLCLDFAALRRYVAARRAALDKPAPAQRPSPAVSEVDDLDQALGLMGLFDDGYLTSTLAPDAGSVRRTLGLIAR